MTVRASLRALQLKRNSSGQLWASTLLEQSGSTVTALVFPQVFAAIAEGVLHPDALLEFDARVVRCGERPRLTPVTVPEIVSWREANRSLVIGSGKYAHMTVTVGDIDAVVVGDIDAVVEHCAARLGDPSRWTTPPGYPRSLAFCVIDAVYSTGSHYGSVVNVINRYRAARGDTDGATGLLASIADAGGPRGWATRVAANRKPAHTRLGAPLKAEVVHQAAHLLSDLGIDTVPQFIDGVSPDPQKSEMHAGWKRLPSQGSGVTFNYLLILAGLPSVKPDRMVLRFLAEALGESADPGTARAIELIEAAAGRLQVSPRILDHAVWRYASGRS